MISLLLTATLLTFAADSDSRPTVIVVVGAAGTAEYGEQFNSWADRWEAAAGQGGAEFVRLGQGSEKQATAREQLQQQLDEVAGQDMGTIYLVLIGHGTFDGQHAKFNLAGPDVTAKELASWLEPLERPLAVVNCTSSSGPFLNQLSAANRVIITATKSGAEQNFARFGEYLSEAIVDPALDLDKDRQTSLLEAFLAASSRTTEFYDQQQRLATEHALLDDNGDTLGTPADWFRGIRAVRSANEGSEVDGQLAARMVLVPSPAEAALSDEARQQRDQLESRIAELRSEQDQLDEAVYYAQLEELMVQLARLYQAQ